MYTVTTFHFRLRFTPHRQWFLGTLLSSVSSTQPEKGSVRFISYINNQLVGYVSTERPVCNKSSCDSFSRWQQQCSFPPVTSVHLWITNEHSKFMSPVCLSLLCWWFSTTQHTLGMNEWRLGSGRGGRTENSLLKREERRGDTETSLLGQWSLDSLKFPHLHPVAFV